MKVSIYIQNNIYIVFLFLLSEFIKKTIILVFHVNASLKILFLIFSGNFISLFLFLSIYLI